MLAFSPMTLDLMYRVQDRHKKKPRWEIEVLRLPPWENASSMRIAARESIQKLLRGRRANHFKASTTVLSSIHHFERHALYFLLH